ncbi:POT family-domain-containing protein [Schizophyllum amplum]|uniref:POT family-domain-containing protein n=1 Tax=Schizophyllum amplum TaxID=97359 RepID=A0A550C4Q3_9AGAR|nr:POT family-domain-containing protein [Auriculariopsis ampla]
MRTAGLSRTRKAVHRSLARHARYLIIPFYELVCLRLVPGKIPWAAYIVSFAEFAERASYFGCVTVFTNFIQRPLPEGGNSAGAPPGGTQLNAGALGLGLITATAVVQTFSFLVMALPICGGMLADAKWGLYRSIWIGTGIAFAAHIIMVTASVPAVIASGYAIAPFAISVVILAFGTACIKPCIIPLIVQQSPVRRQYVKTLKSGEQVIVDPGITVRSMVYICSWAVNIGAFLALPSTYAAKRVGFWLAFLIPGLIYLLVPLALLACSRHLVRLPPQGTVILDCYKVLYVMVRRAGFWRALRGGKAWEGAKPSALATSGSFTGKRPIWITDAGWITYDDLFVDELRRAARVCRLFLLTPVSLVAGTSLDTLLTSQGATMTTDGAPNDLLKNFNYLTISVMAPVFQLMIFPWLRRRGIDFSPIRKICAGFLFAASGQVVAAILQWRIYETSPCGYAATACAIGTGVSALSVWWQLPIYALEAVGGILVNFTCYELAMVWAPERMRTVLFAIVVFMAALAAALVLAISPVFVDPNITWVFISAAAACVLCAIAIYFSACLQIFYSRAPPPPP